MDQTMCDLYDKYLVAIHYFNSSLERKEMAEALRSTFRLKFLSKEEFPAWWTRISADKELQSRWLDRFTDPAMSEPRSIERITSELNQIRIRGVAA